MTSKKVHIKPTEKKSIKADSWVNKRTGTKRLTIDLPAQLHTQLKVSCVKADVTMAEMIRQMIETHL